MMFMLDLQMSSHWRGFGQMRCLVRSLQSPEAGRGMRMGGGMCPEPGCFSQEARKEFQITSVD